MTQLSNLQDKFRLKIVKSAAEIQLRDDNTQTTKRKKNRVKEEKKIGSIHSPATIVDYGQPKKKRKKRTLILRLLMFH